MVCNLTEVAGHSAHLTPIRRANGLVQTRWSNSVAFGFVGIGVGKST